MKLIIVGSARCVWDDLEKLLPIECDVMAINDMIMHYPYKIDHAYSNDFDMLNEWVAARRPMQKKLDGKVRKHCCFPCKDAEIHNVKAHGSSGLNAIYVGLELGYDEIIVCGVPLDNSGHYFDPSWVRTNFENEIPNKKRHGADQIRFWSSAAEKWGGKVKSMSGRTRDILGAPDSVYGSK